MNTVVLAVVLPLLAAFLLQPLDRLSASLARALGPLVMALSAWILIDLWGAHGNVIKGNRLDLFFSSHKKALEWGRRKVKVTVYR